MLRIERSLLAIVAIAAVVLPGGVAGNASASTDDLKAFEGSLAPMAPSTPLEEPLFHFEWTSGPARGGMATVAGYVYNDYGRSAENVELAITTLDDGGHPVGRQVQRLGDTLPSRGRGYFDVQVPAGSSYRLDVLDYDFVENHGRN
ncbi:MAG TPA: hypothetical protein VMI34_13265 [Candidatus Bathyarchaeia archaeon]|nr:hypothetical protein [Candidatus Bathyarchaeia archaeon]